MQKIHLILVVFCMTTVVSAQDIRTWNVALLPNTLTVQNPNGIPVTINSVNGGCSPGNSCGTLSNCYNGTYSQYFTTGYNNYYPSSLGSVTGSTTKMTATSSIIGCQTYRMHLAISNTGDNALPSSVFIEEGSFHSPGVQIGSTYTGGGAFVDDDTLIQNCKDCDITFSLSEGSLPPLGSYPSISVSTDGNAVLGQDFTLLMPNGQALSATNNLFVFDTTLVKLHMEILHTAQFAPNEIKEVIVYFVSERCPGDVSSRKTDTMHFYLSGSTVNNPHSEFTVQCLDSCYTWNGVAYSQSGDYTQTFTAANGCDSIVTLHLTVKVGVDDHNLAKHIKLWPNPAKDVLNVDCGSIDPAPGTELLILDMNGKVLRTIPITDPKMSVNVSGMANGVYLARVRTAKGEISKRFVLQR